MGRSEALKVFKVWTNPRFFSTSTVSFCLIHLSQWHQHGTLWTLTLINICFLQKIINSHLKILFVCINYVISESFHYISPFPSAPFNIIFAFQFIISWFPTHKFWRSAFSPNTPRYLTSLKLSQITHSFGLRFQFQVSAVPQSCPLSVTPILGLGWTLLLTHSCTGSGTKVEGTLQLFLLTHC